MSTNIVPLRAPSFTPQRYGPGSAGRRIVAHFVDGLVISVVSMPSLILVGLIFGLRASMKFDPKSNASLAAYGANWLVSVVLFYLYYGWFYGNKGATPGKMLMGLRVVRNDDGTRLGYGRAFGRELSKVFGIMLLFTGPHFMSLGRMGIVPLFEGPLFMIAGIMFLLVDSLFMVFRKDKRALHDLICNTRVLRRKDA